MYDVNWAHDKSLISWPCDSVNQQHNFSLREVKFLSKIDFARVFPSFLAQFSDIANKNNHLWILCELLKIPFGLMLLRHFKALYLLGGGLLRLWKNFYELNKRSQDLSFPFGKLVLW